MKEPKVNFGFIENCERTVLMAACTDGAGISTWHRWDMGEFEHGGYHALCHYVGEGVLRLLARAHPAEFAKFPLLVPPKPPYEDPHDVAGALMTLSILEKTTDYAAAIDALIARYGAELGRTDLPETWASIKRELIEGRM